MKLLADSLLEYETLTKEQIDSLVETGKMPEENSEVKTDEDKSLTELKNLAKEKGIKGYTKMTKEELEKALDEEEIKEKRKLILKNSFFFCLKCSF